MSDADRAMKAYKSSIDGAAGEYEEMTELFDAAVASGRPASLPNRRVIVEEFSTKALTFIVKSSSDWQQDKNATQWHLSPQPSLTHFFSKRVSYVHIFTMESFRETTGVTKFDLNLFYARKQRVGVLRCQTKLPQRCLTSFVVEILQLLLRPYFTAQEMMRMRRLRRAESPWLERIDVFMFFASFRFFSTHDHDFYLAVLAVRSDIQLNLTDGVQADFFKSCRLCALSTFYKALDRLLEMTIM